MSIFASAAGAGGAAAAAIHSSRTVTRTVIIQTDPDWMTSFVAVLFIAYFAYFALVGVAIGIAIFRYFRPDKDGQKHNDT